MISLVPKCKNFQFMPPLFSKSQVFALKETSYLELLQQTVYQKGILHRVGNLAYSHFCQETSTPDNNNIKQSKQSTNGRIPFNLHKKIGFKTIHVTLN